MPLAHHAESPGLTRGCRAARRGRNVRALRSVLLTYAMYNFDLGYVQVRDRASHAQTPPLHQHHAETLCEAGACLCCCPLYSLAAVRCHLM